MGRFPFRKGSNLGERSTHVRVQMETEEAAIELIENLIVQAQVIRVMLAAYPSCSWFCRLAALGEFYRRSGAQLYGHSFGG